MGKRTVLIATTVTALMLAGALLIDHLAGAREDLGPPALASAAIEAGESMGRSTQRPAQWAGTDTRFFGCRVQSAAGEVRAFTNGDR